ncbi:hypothetical protein HGRIS_008431 [Hohenbuehelia grisea]|uniref:Uncharacterized protein n=1 Tax=Hohenbuehelia grisea TaxID=104357 RepID=A0ABR3J7Z3_9AGAR
MDILSKHQYEILRGYAALHRPNAFILPYCAFADIHDLLLNGLLLNKHLTDYPPSVEYQQKFWKWAIGQLEAALAECSEAGIQKSTVSS